MAKKCPKCKIGDVYEYYDHWSCSRYNHGCDYYKAKTEWEKKQPMKNTFNNTQNTQSEQGKHITTIRCPRCKKGYLVEYPDSWKCSRDDCWFHKFKKSAITENSEEPLYGIYLREKEKK